MPRYRKSDVETHSDRFRPAHPAVNVKVYSDWRRVSLPLDLGSCDGVQITSDERFTHAWIEANISDSEMQAAWDASIEQGWDCLTSDAQEIFGAVKVYSEGRSGGWCVVHGLPDLESWDALMLTKWARFERYAKRQAADIPRATLDFLYFNIFLPQVERNALLASGMTE